ncbi:PEP phosphonomutase-related enzyme [Pyrobaculum oguniense TE7]|uniref:PEP phosphonomutase-related enzyme n=1 Tax=Pyrobaculum oguniense (strain DSM 13380 / JCM 10595 / TE7) TaxID=698757 RepID=H6QAQ8_PYROT|nr:PEP phosphonomutase-related enzyme [Pyrobaculum oguniense TE7]
MEKLIGKLDLYEKVLKNPGAEFRRLLKTEPYIFTTGVYTPLQAKLAQIAGLKAVYISGYSCSVGYLGAADLNILTLEEYVWIARHIANAVTIPVVADAESGFGSLFNAMRAVKEFWRAGVAAIHVEDQVFPKRCGHLAGKQVMPLEDAVAMFKAIDRVRRNIDPDFFIIARTDAIGASNVEPERQVDEAIRRAKAYINAGADMVWAEFTRPDDVDAITKFAEGVRKEFPDVPLAFNYSSSFRWHKSRVPIRFKWLAELGYKYIFITLGALHAETYAVYNFVKDLATRQEEALWELQKLKEGHPTESHHKLGDFDYFKELEVTFYPWAKVKYERGAGYGSEKEKGDERLV